jgi:hypothetical protein
VQALQPEMPDDHPLSLNSTSKWHTFFKVDGATRSGGGLGGKELCRVGRVVQLLCTLYLDSTCRVAVPVSAQHIRPGSMLQMCCRC